MTAFELRDMQEVLAEIRGELSDLDSGMEVHFPPDTLQRIAESFERSNRSTVRVIGDHTLRMDNAGQQSRFVSVQELPLLQILSNVIAETDKYRIALDAVAKSMGYASREDGREIFERMPSPNWDFSSADPEISRIEAAMEAELELPEEREKLKKFISEPEWSGIGAGKKLNRNDFQEGIFLKAGNLVAAANAGRYELAKAMKEASVSFSEIHFSDSDALSPKPSSVGVNRIYYGAPGTGKSNAVDLIVDDTNAVRTVFHPETQNSDFFGCLKPVMKGEKVHYEFAPGPFSQALKRAFLNEDDHFYLVIEELNRAPAAAVFGELFQLLDRDDGIGRYKVNFPNPESKKWFFDQGVDVEQLMMPSNLSIYATMNGADQGVFPLDTAFRRRWEQKYVPLYAGDGPTGNIHFIGQSGESWLIPWRSFVESLNDLLVQKFDVAEDRLLGLWFVKSGELGQSVPSKILLYLWDDLLRHENRGLLFSKGIKTFGELDKALEYSQRIFDAAFLEELEKLSVPVEVKSPEDIVESVSSD